MNKIDKEISGRLKFNHDRYNFLNRLKKISKFCFAFYVRGMFFSYLSSQGFKRSFRNQNKRTIFKNSVRLQTDIYNSISKNCKKKTFFLNN